MGVAWFYHAQSACQPGSETSVNSANSPVITNPVDNNNRQPTNLKLQVNFYQTNFSSSFSFEPQFGLEIFQFPTDLVP
jgi:hypothetical protein